MSQVDKAKRFASLHRSDTPLFLYNIWDAGGAKTLADAGAAAIATGSMSMALAHGYEDGQNLPLDFVLAIVARICTAVALPVTVDFEGGYAESLEALAENTAKVIAAGAVGINFEDQIVGRAALYALSDQCERISAIDRAAKAAGVPLFINARTDLFLQESDKAWHGALVDEAIARGKAYAGAGASGFFIPGLSDLALTKVICDAVDLPVNVMRYTPDKTQLVAAGVSRISCGPGPYFEFVKDLKAAYLAKDR